MRGRTKLRLPHIGEVMLGWWQVFCPFEDECTGLLLNDAQPVQSRLTNQLEVLFRLRVAGKEVPGKSRCLADNDSGEMRKALVLTVVLHLAEDRSKPSPRDAGHLLECSVGQFCRFRAASTSTCQTWAASCSCVIGTSITRLQRLRQFPEVISAVRSRRGP